MVLKVALSIAFVCLPLMYLGHKALMLPTADPRVNLRRMMGRFTQDEEFWMTWRFWFGVFGFGSIMVAVFSVIWGF